MARSTVAVEKRQTIRTMLFFLLFVSLLGIVPTRALLSLSPLLDCPNVTPQNDVNIDQVTGSWRLAYLFVDENEELEEDNTCAVAEITKVNDTKLEMLLYVDGRKDEFTIDRYTKEFDVTILTPGEWILHTSFTHLEYVHVTVISFSHNHLILTFCANPFEPEPQLQPPIIDNPNSYDSFLNSLDGDNADDIFKPHGYNKFFREFDDFEGRLERQRRVRRPSRLLRGKRFISNDLGEGPQDESAYEKLLNILRESKKSSRPQKHLWTAILVKDNDVSALRFVEKASLLMKYGFQIAKAPQCHRDLRYRPNPISAHEMTSQHNQLPAWLFELPLQLFNMFTSGYTRWVQHYSDSVTHCL